MTLINNKIKQFIKGNWGKPEHSEQGLKLKDFDLREHIFKRKKKRAKREYIYKGFCCPFCNVELPLDEELIARKKKECEGKLYTIMEDMYRLTICPQCKAFQVDECPACKRETWCREGWYKHQAIGCGFEGKKLYKWK